MTHYKKTIQNGANPTYKLAIINCLSGGGGHKFGRLVCCCENVHWYAHKDNGMTPWEFATTKIVDESRYARHHYDRILLQDVYIPLIGSRIEKYWDNDGWLNNWYKIMSTFELPDKYLTFVVHDNPEYLRNLFPESFIINLLSDPVQSTKHHLNTSAKFRIDYDMIGQIPDYESVWVKAKNEILKINPHANVTDLWMYMNNKTEQEYADYCLESNIKANQINIAQSSYADITMHVNTPDISMLEQHLGKMDDNYKKLIP